MTDYSETPVVTMLYDKSWNYYELFPYDMEQPGYDVYSQMKRFVDFMGNMTFASPSELTEEQMVEYAMVTIFDDYQRRTGALFGGRSEQDGRDPLLA